MDILQAAMEDYRMGDYTLSTARRLAGLEDQSLTWLVEPVILGLLATGAIGGVLAGLGPAFWATWHGLAALGFLGVRWRRPALAVD